MSTAIEQGMAYAVLGYVPDQVAKSLGSQAHGQAIELRVERGKDHEVIRIQPHDVAGVLHGASHNGETSVQVLLKENAQVETVSRGVAGDLFLRQIKDPVTVIPRNNIYAIYVDHKYLTKIPGIVFAGSKLEST
jgi:hypothetical protein